MHIDAYPRIFMRIYAYPRIFMHIHACALLSMHIHAYPCIYMHIRGYAWMLVGQLSRSSPEAVRNRSEQFYAMCISVDMIGCLLGSRPGPLWKLSGTGRELFYAMPCYKQRVVGCLHIFTQQCALVACVHVLRSGALVFLSYSVYKHVHSSMDLLGRHNT